MEGDGIKKAVKDVAKISIHALRVEGDIPPCLHAPCDTRFLSTPSGWRATALDLYLLVLIAYFYPRPPGGGRRQGGKRPVLALLDFYPRPPGGGRHTLLKVDCQEQKFLSTPSGWRATHRRLLRHTARRFLSTPSGWRATGGHFGLSIPYIPFLSTPSGWRATD